jgi:large subunit ribosomal protein L23
MEIYNKIKNNPFPKFIENILISEKSLDLLKKNSTYSFLINPNFKKDQIKIILEKFFKNKIIKINVISLPEKLKKINKKKGKIKTYKKVLIKLKNINI